MEDSVTTPLVEQAESSSSGENVECQLEGSAIQVESLQGSVDSHIEQSCESNQTEKVAVLDNEVELEEEYETDMNDDVHDVDMSSLNDDDDEHNPPIETANPMDTTDIEDSGETVTKDNDGATLEDQNMGNDDLGQTNMKTDPPNLNAKPIGMESTKQQAKLEKMAKWILLLVKQRNETVDLEKVEADFKEFEHLISELDDDDEELVDYWLIRKTLIWNEISKFKCKVRESSIDKKLDWIANRLEQRLSEHGLSSADWTELKCQFETFAQLVTELERTGELGMKWDAQYNRIRVEMQKRS